MNGYQFGDTGYDGNGMPQDGQQDMQNMMVMGRPGMDAGAAAEGGVPGEQSMGNMVNMTNMNNNLSSKMNRRQSLPQGYTNTAPNQSNNFIPAVRRINSMMEFNADRSPGTAMNSFQFNPGMNMNQTGNLSGNNTPTQGAQVPIQNRRQTGNTELNLNTNFSSQTQNFAAMMSGSPAYASPANQSGMEMDINTPYIDPSLNMQMDFGLDQNGMGNSMGEMGGNMANLGNNMSNMNNMNNMGMAGNMGNGMMSNTTNTSLPSNMPSNMGATADSVQMPMYNQSQFSQNAPVSPMHSTTPQSTPGGPTRVASHDAIHRSGSNTQYGRKGQRPSLPHQLSRSQSAHVSNAPSPQQGTTPHANNDSQQAQQAGPTPPEVHENPSRGFQGQPQNPLPGSLQDRGVGRVGNDYDGINGPLPVKPANYNPNNQNFPWQPVGGSWPSTMVNKPHMQSAYKNAYSSTGFDMLGVLVCDLGLSQMNQG